MSPHQATLLANLALLLAMGASSGCQTPAPAPVFAAKLAPSKLVFASREGVLADFPCSRCHAHISPDERPTTRVHWGIRLAHFEAAQSCTICHDQQDRDKLHLLAGRSVSFDAAHELCGQCHGEKLHDWNIGAHGKHVGGWAGTKYRYTCTDCHDAHAPARPRVVASPAPPFPYFGIPKHEQP